METIAESENYDCKRIVLKKRLIEYDKDVFKELEIELVDFSLLKWSTKTTLKILFISAVGLCIYGQTFALILALTVTAFYLLRLNSTTTRVNLLFIPSIGIQTKVYNGLGGYATSLHDLNKIKSVIINEHISWLEVTFYLCLIYSNESECDERESLKPLFLSIRPKLDILRIVYNELYPLLDIKQ